MIGVYKITNTLNGHCYIGSSATIEQRLKRHYYDLVKNIHRSIYLQRAFNKYGKTVFELEVLEECTKDVLIEREQFWMDKELPIYNMSKVAGSCLGYKHTQESTEKKRKYALDNNVKPPESTWKDKQRAIIMLNYDTLEVLESFESISAACRAIGKDSSFVHTLRKAADNKRYSAFGYRWVYKLEDIPNLRKKIIGEKFELQFTLIDDTI